jgi:hypothetical protein
MKPLSRTAAFEHSGTIDTPLSQAGDKSCLGVTQ